MKPSTHATEEETLDVLRVDGRYPYSLLDTPVFRSENIQSNVTANEDGTASIRLADNRYADMWIELTVRGSVAALLTHTDSEATDGDT